MTLSSSQQPETQGHYPKTFPGAPPLSPGEYHFSWLGYVEGNENELLLAKGSFKVNQLGQVFGSKPP